MARFISDPHLKIFDDNIRDIYKLSLDGDYYKHKEDGQAEFKLDFAKFMTSSEEVNFCLYSFEGRENNMTLGERIFNKPSNDNIFLRKMCDVVVVFSFKSKYHVICIEYKNLYNEKGKSQALNGISLFRYLIELHQTHYEQQNFPNFDFDYCVISRPKHSRKKSTVRSNEVIEFINTSTDFMKIFNQLEMKRSAE